MLDRIMRIFKMLLVADVVLFTRVKYTPRLSPHATWCHAEVCQVRFADTDVA